MMKNSCLIFCIIAILISATPMLQAQVAINTDGGNPHTCAMLDIESNSKGLLIPRLTTAQRTALAGTAENGLMVYDITLHKFFYFKDGAWEEGSLGGLWTRTGSQTYLTNTGDEVGIGTTNPGFLLDVQASSNAYIRVIGTSTGTSYGGILLDRPNTNSKMRLLFRTEGSNKWGVGLLDANNNFAISRDPSDNDGTFHINQINGFVGIGTNTPEASLHIEKSVTETDAIFGANIGYPSAVDVCIGNLTGNSFLYVGQGTENKGILMWDHNSTASDALFRIGTYAGNNDLTLQHAGGNVGIGSGSPDAKLDVNGTTKLGASGTVFSEIREITGTTHSTNNYVMVSLPSGYNETNTRVISVEINYLNDRWVGLGRKYGQTSLSDNVVSYQTLGTSFYIFYPDHSYYKNKAFRAILIKI